MTQWDGRSIYLGTFPFAEAERKAKEAKQLTKLWRTTKKVRPSREWVIEELERLHIVSRRRSIDEKITEWAQAAVQGCQQAAAQAHQQMQTTTSTKQEHCPTHQDKESTMEIGDLLHRTLLPVPGQIGFAKRMARMYLDASTDVVAEDLLRRTCLPVPGQIGFAARMAEGLENKKKAHVRSTRLERIRSQLAAAQGCQQAAAQAHQQMQTTAAVPASNPMAMMAMMNPVMMTTTNPQYMAMINQQNQQMLAEILRLQEQNQILAFLASQLAARSAAASSAAPPAKAEGEAEDTKNRKM